jgi:hypothetical protein
MNITRENIGNKVNEIDNKIAELKVKKDNIEYKTKGHSFNCYGAVEAMPIESVVNAMKSLMENKKDVASAVAALGLGEDEYKINDEFTYKGFSYTTWENDFKTRVTELRFKKNIAKLTKVRNILFKNLSEEDIFNREMNEAGNLIEGLLD